MITFRGNVVNIPVPWILWDMKFATKKNPLPPDFRDGPQGTGATAAVEDGHL